MHVCVRLYESNLLPVVEHHHKGMAYNMYYPCMYVYTYILRIM